MSMRKWYRLIPLKSLRFYLMLFSILLTIKIDWLNSVVAEMEYDVAKRGAVVLIKDVSGRGLGTGFVIKPSGLILTSYTVVTKNLEVLIHFERRDKLVGKVIKSDRKNNLALVKVETGDLPFLKLGDSGTVRIADKVMAVGYPVKGRDNSFEGRVYSIEKAEKLKWLGYSKEIDPFNFLILFKVDIEELDLIDKGSPLLNTKGEVIGINVLIHRDKKDFLYAIAINKVFEVFRDEFREVAEEDVQAQKGKFEVRIRGIRYAMYVPSYYTPQKNWPLILAFYPAGDGGEIRDFWVENAERSGFIVAGGYTFQGDIWNTYDDYRIFKMLEDVYMRYNIDRNRVYLTGLSGGAVFAYYLGINYPEFFSAIAAVTSGSISCIERRLDYSRSSKKHIPILIIHGTEDTVVPLSCIKRDRDKLRSYGYKVSYQEIKGMGHEHRPYKDEIYKNIIKFFNRIRK